MEVLGKRIVGALPMAGNWSATWYACDEVEPLLLHLVVVYKIDLAGVLGCLAGSPVVTNFGLFH